MSLQGTSEQSAKSKKFFKKRQFFQRKILIINAGYYSSANLSHEKYAIFCNSLKMWVSDVMLSFVAKNISKKSILIF